MPKKIKLFILLDLVIVALVFFYIFSKPSHNRDWEVGLDKFPQVQVDNNLVTINNIRDWRYSETEPISFEYTKETYDAQNLTNVWFVVEPFAYWDAMAHTYFVFDFNNKEPLAFSIESRREKGENYNALSGLFNKYELIYIWGTETDITGRRALLEKNKLYMYPLAISKEQKENLFLKLAYETQSLESEPKFYNTLTSNCTNLLAKHVREINKKAIPWHSLILPPGLSDKMLYDLGYIDNKKPFKEIKQSHYITDVYVQSSNLSPSQSIRDFLLNYE